MPKLWNETIQAHRQEVREAILRTTWELVAAHGVRAVTMSQIAEGVGIGRATLYKYFPDVDAILAEWHHQHVTEHLTHLTRLRDQHEEPSRRLEAVLTAFAQIAQHRGRHGPELGALLHHNERIAAVEHQLLDLLRGLLVEASDAARVRADVPAEELAAYCLHALTAAERLTSAAAVRRLVSLTLAGLRPQP